MAAPNWYHVFNVDGIASPALLVYLDRVDDNIREMIGIAGSVERLRPHVKTHKLPEVIRRQLVLGIRMSARARATVQGFVATP